MTAYFACSLKTGEHFVLKKYQKGALLRWAASPALKEAPSAMPLLPVQPGAASVPEPIPRSLQQLLMRAWPCAIMPAARRQDERARRARRAARHRAGAAAAAPLPGAVLRPVGVCRRDLPGARPGRARRLSRNLSPSIACCDAGSSSPAVCRLARIRHRPYTRSVVTPDTSSPLPRDSQLTPHALPPTRTATAHTQITTWLHPLRWRSTPTRATCCTTC